MCYEDFYGSKLTCSNTCKDRLERAKVLDQTKDKLFKRWEILWKFASNLPTLRAMLLKIEDKVPLVEKKTR